MDSHPQDHEATPLATADQEFAFDVESFANLDEWLEGRRHGIGASDAPTILGLTKHSPLALYHEKKGLELPEERKGRARLLQFGLLMEPVAAGLFEMEVSTVTLGHNRPIAWPLKYHLERSRTVPWLTCTVDRWGKDDTLPLGTLQSGASPAGMIANIMVPVELKNVSVWAAQDWLDLGEVPLAYQVQVQHQLAVTGATRGYIAAIIGGVDFKWARIDRDDSFIAILLQQLEAFWQALETDTPPPADGLEETKKALNALRLRAEQSEVVIELPPEFMDLDDKREQLATAIKDMEAEKERIDNTVRQYFIEHGAPEPAALGVMRDGRSYSWKVQHRAGYIVEATKFPVLRRHGAKKAKKSS